MERIQRKAVDATKDGFPIHLFQSPASRALTVGYIQQAGSTEQFIPNRLHFGVPRERDTYQATLDAFSLPEIQDILSRYKPTEISTITILRETLSCRLWEVLYENGVTHHFGDAFIGAMHMKNEEGITTAYQYENTEGLTPNGLWILTDSICMGRNLGKTLENLLPKFKPKELLILAPIASRIGIETVAAIIIKHHVPVSFLAWGALFGVDEETKYDMPWGHKDTEPVDIRDQDVFIAMYGPGLCMGGDFGNNYYSPTLAKQLYDDQLKTHHITPKIPETKEIRKIYKPEELLIRQ